MLILLLGADDLIGHSWLDWSPVTINDAAQVVLGRRAHILHHVQALTLSTLLIQMAQAHFLELVSRCLLIISSERAFVVSSERRKIHAASAGFVMFETYESLTALVLQSISLVASDRLKLLTGLVFDA